MKKLKTVLCILLVAGLLAGGVGGIFYAVSGNSPGGLISDPTGATDPSGDPIGPAIPLGPVRPGDPGVVAPLEENNKTPEDGVVWDMENTPDDLFSAGWATPNFSSEAAWTSGNVSFLGVPGKGYQGSRALAIRQNGKYSWADVYAIGMKRDETAFTNWTSGEILWIWYDSTEIGSPMMLELELNGERMKMGIPYYSLEDGGKVAQKAGSTPEGYTGAGYGRIPLKPQFRGWVGVPLKAFGSDFKKVASFNIHLSYNASAPVGKALYLDNFCLTSAEEGPMGAELSNVSSALATSDKPVWDFEKLPGDPVGAGWAGMDGAGYDGFKPGNLKLSGVSGKGVGGSRALRVSQIGEYHWADTFCLNLTSDVTTYTDWSQGEVLWFWVDATELRNDLNLDLFPDNRKPSIGASYYGINGSKQKQKAGTLINAYDGAGYGRIVIGAGYKGWVGIPLSAYKGGISDIVSINMHLAYSNGSGNSGRSVYFDEFWVLKEGELPKTATAGNIALLQGGNGGADPNVGEVLELPCQVWSMEKLPKDPVSADWAFPTYGDDKDFIKGNITVSRADGKGYEGTAALGIRQVGAYVWADIYEFDLSKDSSAKRNWTGGKMLWYWIDTTEHTADVQMDLMIDSVRPKSNEKYYLVAEGAEQAETRYLQEAYEGAGYGRITVPGGFHGFVGIALDGFQKPLSSATFLSFHVAYASKEVKGKSVYLDAFWVTADATSPTGVAVDTTPEEKVPTTDTKPVWDMENTPDDLSTAGWVSSDFASDDEFIPGNVTYHGADGKGRDGTRALEVRFNGSYVWADTYNVSIRSDKTAALDWSGEKMLWFWIDAGEFTADIEIELLLDGAKANKGAGCYQCVGGAPKKTADLIVAWDDSGRIPVQAGYVGFLGIPLSAYGQVGEVNTLRLHFAGDGIMAHRSLYLDEFWVTPLDKTPVNAEDGYIKEPETGELTLPLEVWNMENLPEDLIAAGWAKTDFTTHEDYVAGRITMKPASGKGWKGSQALEYAQKQPYNWSDEYTLYLSNDETAITNWAGGEMLWLWVDAREFTKTGIKMDFYVDGRSLVIGEPYFLSDGTTAQQAGKLPQAYDNADWARLPIEAGYQGWIGIPFSSFKTAPVSANQLKIHVAYTNQTEATGKHLYLDAFTLTDSKTGPSGETIHWPQEKEDILATPDKAAWDMENLPQDLLAENWAQAKYPNESEFKPGNVTLTAAPGKGRKGTQALAWTQVGKYNWTDEFLINMEMDETFANDWREGAMLMIWVDATEFASTGAELRLEMFINGVKPAENTSYFLERNGILVKAGTLPDAWGDSNPAGWGRLPLPSGFRGWIGVPLSAYGEVRVVEELKLHLSAKDGKDFAGHSLYLDDLWILDGNVLPKDAVSENGGSQEDITTVVNEGAPVTPDSYLLTNPAQLFQTVKAYGVSDCWWANGVGTGTAIPQIQQLLFGQTGIALNNYRVNIGGGVKDDRSDSPNYPWRAVYSPLKEDGTLDITRNKGSWQALQTLRSLEESGMAQVSDYTLFMNSPPSTMTDNGLTYNNNKLREDCYDAYAEYVADVVQLYQLNGVSVRYVSPVNEPMLDAWTKDAGQESCVYTMDQVVTLYEKVIDALAERKLDTKISPADFNSWTAALNNMDKLLDNQKIASHIDHISVHDYSGSDTIKALVYEKANKAGLAVHMTEWCMAIQDNADTMDTALDLAKMIYTDMTVANTDTWSWWLGVGAGGYSDGLLYVDEDGSVYETTKRLWAFGNYSKFTKGYTRVGLDETALPKGVYASAYAYTGSDGKSCLVYVVLNENETGTAITLAGMPKGAKANLYVTSDLFDCQQIGYMTADCGYTLDAKSVTTMVFQDIDLDQVDPEAVPSGELPLQVWDMETLPEDLFASGNASTNTSPDTSANVGAIKEPGKGYNGSAALGYVYKNYGGNDYWANYLRIQTSGLDYTSNWSGGEMLWFWVDTGDFQSQLNLDLWLNNVKTAIGSEYYFWSGEGDAAKGGTLNAAWDQADYGRIPLEKGYRGFVGLPLSAFDGLAVKDVHDLYLYIQPDDDKNDLPKTLYLDEFWITELEGLPAVEPPREDLKPTTGTVVWDLEGIPDNMKDSGWATCDHSTNDQYHADNVLLKAGAGKGYLDSRALGITQMGDYSWTDEYKLQLDEAKSRVDWSKGDILWFWVSNEMNTRVTMDLDVNGQKLTTGKTYYLSDGTTVMRGEIPEAYTGSGNQGRIPVPAMYRGWVGIPKDAYHGDTNEDILKIHLGYRKNSESTGKTIYLDQFVLTKGDVGPCGEPLKGEKTPEEGTGNALWDMSQLPANLKYVEWAKTDNDSNGEYTEGNVLLQQAAGKGYRNSHALAITQVGTYSWTDEYKLRLDEANSKVDWNEGDILWFWVSNEMNTQVTMDLYVNGQPLMKDGTYYLSSDGKTVTEGKMPEAYSGAGRARVPVAAGYQGWIGVPETSYSGGTNGDALKIHLGFEDGNAAKGGTLYLDEFLLTDGETGPLGEKITPEEPPFQSELIQNMEEIPEDLFASHDAGTWEKAEGLVGAVKAPGKGYNASAALAYEYKKYDDTNFWAARVVLSANGTLLPKDLSQGDVFWFFVDTGEFQTALNLQVDFCSKGTTINPAIDVPYYLWSGQGEATAYTTPPAWNGAEYSRIPLEKGYRGFVGISMSAYPNLERQEMESIAFYIEPSGEKERLPLKLYLDEFWMAAEGKLPQVEPETVKPAEAGTGNALWDMANLPEDLVASGWAKPEFPNDNAYQPGNVVINGVNGKGYLGSHALAVTQKGDYCWADVFKLQLDEKNSLVDWDKGEILWFWVNNQMHTKVTMDFYVNGQELGINGLYYLSDGETVTKGQLPEAWTNAGKGRVPVEKDYQGWIGVSHTAYKDGDTNSDALKIHLGFDDGNAAKNGTLYLDEFLLTDGKTGPLGEKIPQEEPAFRSEQIQDMEEIEEDLFVSGDAGTWEQANGLVGAVKTPGKGYNGSAALSYVYKEFKQENYWAAKLVLYANEKLLPKDLSQGDVFWFFVDTGEFQTQLNLQVDFCSHNKTVEPAIDATYYLWSGEGEMTSHTAIKTWDGATSGRLPLEKGYRGFVGVSMSAYSDLDRKEMESISFYIEPNDDKEKLPLKLHLDEFWMAAEGQLPQVEPETPSEAGTGNALWDMANLPEDLIESEWAKPEYPNNYKPGNLEINGVSDKGYLDSHALAITQKGDYDWADVFKLKLTEENDLVDWTKGEILWFWVDNQMHTKVTMDFYVNGQQLAIGGTYYLSDGKNVTKGQLPVAYGGADWARVPIEENYKGWIGVAHTAYKDGNTNSDALKIHLGFGDNNAAKGNTLYLDEFLLTDGKTGPLGEEIPQETISKGGKQLWDMEQLPEDLIEAGHVTSYFAEHVGAIRADGKGYNGSAALGYVYKDKVMGDDYWGNCLTIKNLSQMGVDCSLTDGEVLWFWVDTREFKSELKLEVKLNNIASAVDEKYYTWNGSGQPEEKILPPGWGGAETSRIPLKDYQGFIGVPLSAYSGLGQELQEIYLYMEPWDDKNDLPKTLYLDEFWLTEMGTVPAVD